MTRTPLAVIRGLTYSEAPQVLNRWLIPTYQTAFRWTGNRADSEDATSWALFGVAAHLRLPELVQVADDHVADAAVEAVVHHWTHRYGMHQARCSEIHAAESAMPRTLEALVASLNAEMRVVLVLRFLRRRSLAAIAAQLAMRREAAARLMITALAGVAQSVGFSWDPYAGVQVDHVASFVDDLVARRKPIRFDVLPATWPSLVGATHLQAAIAGNSLPCPRFVKGLEDRLVTRLRIWSV